MNKQTNDIYQDDVDFSLGEQVRDILPSPEQLVRKTDMQRVTMELPKNTVSFFKEQAKNHGGSYQVMIRELLSHYVFSHSGQDKDKF